MKFQSSFVETLQNALTLKMIRFNLIFIATFGYLLVGISFFLILACGVLASFLTIQFLKKKLGFLNGDTLGTTLELIEIILFLGIALWY
jgi:adenosylcobinamide-GDP ribazoletransferase